MKRLCYQLLANVGYRLAEWAERRLDPSLVSGMRRLRGRPWKEHERRILQLQPPR